MAKYIAKYVFDEGYWGVEIPAVKGCFTQGPTLHEARSNILEVLSLMTTPEEAAAAELVDAIEIPGQISLALHELSESPALRELSSFGIPVADVGILLGSAPSA